MFGGGTLNAPLVNYYEHGTFLTLNHAHTALFGAFGLLGIGLIYFCLRYVAADEHPFGEKLGRWAFWLYNGGLVLWIVFNFFPIGWPQLDAVYEHGLAYARSQAFYDTTLFWQWMRLPGDVVFALGALLMAWDFIVKLRPLFPRFVARLIPGSGVLPAATGGANEHRRQRRGAASDAGFSDPGFPAVLSRGRALVGRGARAVDRHVRRPATAVPSRFDPLAWHIHEMLFGFVMAAVAGFLLTAIPNWTGRRPVSGGLLGAARWIVAAGPDRLPGLGACPRMARCRGRSFVSGGSGRGRYPRDRCRPELAQPADGGTGDRSRASPIF